MSRVVAVIIQEEINDFLNDYFITDHDLSSYKKPVRNLSH